MMLTILKVMALMFQVSLFSSFRSLLKFSPFGTHFARDFVVVFHSGSIAGKHLSVPNMPHNGLAPDAKLFFDDIGLPGGSLDGLPETWAELVQNAYDAGTRIHSGSSFV